MTIPSYVSWRKAFEISGNGMRRSESNCGSLINRAGIAARALYANFGFRLAESRSVFLSGRMLKEEMWQKQLASH